MRQHPDLMAISRDRGGEYADATTAGAPQALQCADRFHILKNLGEAVEGLLARHLAAHRKKETQSAQDEQAPLWLPTRSAKRSPKLEQLQRARREERLARYEQVIAFRKQGLSYEAIARQIGMGASTVQSWLAAGAFPERKPREQGNLLDRYLPYVVERWAQGCHNIAQIYQELLARGYKGSYASVYGNLVRHLPAGRKHAPGADALYPALLLARQATFLFLRRSEELRAEERETILVLRQTHPEVDLMADLVQQFVQMLRTRVKANVLLTHFGNLKWTHPHGGERESVFLRSERATPLICSAMAAQSVPSEEPGIKVAPLLFALLTPGSSDGWKNAPIAFSKKTTSCFFAQEE
jgi:hypothetical protein